MQINNLQPSIRMKAINNIKFTKPLAEKLMGDKFSINALDKIYWCSESIKRFKECVDKLRSLSA